MLKYVRQEVVLSLWERYRHLTPQMQRIEQGLKQKGVASLLLDHFAIIDLPGPHSGIPYLREIFSAIGYLEQGKDYLAEKQNDFLWMTESDSFEAAAKTVLPQVVVADFRLTEMPVEVRNIIEKYSSQAQPAPIAQIAALKQQAEASETAAQALIYLIVQYLQGRDWPLPTLQEYQTVRAFNELLSWVLIFGRRPNHFTLSVHHLDHFDSLAAFHTFVASEMCLALNEDGGVIKGGRSTGIAQGSTTGVKERVQLMDGEVEVPTGFVEFVWRYPLVDSSDNPLWKDYFTGFIAQHADRVIESLYVRK